MFVPIDEKKITIVHKVNILKAPDGLFPNIGRQLARKYHDIECDDMIVDDLCMCLVHSPQQFDIRVLPNLYGDFISAGLIGVVVMAPSANFGDDIAIFEPTNGSSPKYTGQNKVNPMAIMLSDVLMLRHISEVDAANKLEGSIAAVIAEGKNATYDLQSKSNPPMRTSQVADTIIEKLKGGNYAQ